MKILVLSPHLPYARIPHAGGVFLTAHLERLAADHDLTILVPASDEARQHIDEVPPSLDVRLTTFDAEPRPTLSTQWERLRRRIRFAAIRTPALAGFRTADVRGLAAAADLVELHWIDTALLTRELRGGGVTTPLAVFAYDVTAESMPARARRMHSRLRSLAGVPLERIRRRTEVADLRAADLVVVFKPQDQDLLRAIGVSTPSHVVQPYLELPTVGAPRARMPRSLLFTGAMWRPENQDGVHWFLTEVWPRVLARVPDATFTIAGASPPDELVRLADGVPGVTFTGTVPTLEPFYEAAQVFVAPLFVAGGLKFKVPQAMAYGLPVIATPLAATGITDDAPPGVVWSVSDDPAAMAAAVIDAIEQPEHAAAVGTAAATWVRERFSFDASTRELVARYREIARPAG